jgi:hypothetical protein
MTASDDNNDTYALPKVPSDDNGESSEDETFESIARHVHDTGHEVARSPACKPEAEDKISSGFLPGTVFNRCEEDLRDTLLTKPALLRSQGLLICMPVA